MTNHPLEVTSRHTSGVCVTKPTVGGRPPYGRTSPHRVIPCHGPAEGPDHVRWPPALPQTRTLQAGQTPRCFRRCSRVPELPPPDTQTSPRRPAGTETTSSPRRSFDRSLARPDMGRLLLAALSPSLAFQALPCPGRPGAPADGQRGSQISDGLRTSGHVASRHYPAGLPTYARGKHAILSARAKGPRDFAR
jgi:hypothetical protein